MTVPISGTRVETRFWESSITPEVEKQMREICIMDNLLVRNNNITPSGASMRRFPTVQPMVFSWNGWKNELT
jgi:hypothetical protein